MNNNYIRWIKTLSLFFLFVNPLTAAAACQSGGSAKVLSAVHTTTLEFFKTANKPPITDTNYISRCTKIDSYAKKGWYKWNSKYKPADYALFSQGKKKINAMPQCKPYGQLPRECVDHEVLEVFPMAESSDENHDGPACGVNWQYTVCAYSPFKKGIMPKKERVERDPKKGISGKKRPEERAPRRRLERDR